tara:strand:+ start:6743 stop:8194 length:1452 start_codon:yes stop_codon:yes gene_type:complete
MDKMSVDNQGHFVVTNDGATILRELDVAHPGARMVVDMSKTQEQECKDGTTSVVVLAGKLLENAERLLAKGVHPHVICKGYRQASLTAVQSLNDSRKLKEEYSPDEIMLKVAQTAICGKSAELEDATTIAQMVVDAVTLVDGDDSRIKVVSQVGGTFADSKLFDGVVLNKEFASTIKPQWDGKNAPIVLLNTGLTPPPMHDSMRVQLGSMAEVQQFQMAEQRMLVERAKALIQLDAGYVFCRDGVHEAIIHTLAQEGIGVVSRVPQSDMEAISRLTGEPIYHMTEDIPLNVDGHTVRYATVTEHTIGDIRYISVEVDDDNADGVSTLVLRGATRQTVDELERAFDDAIGVTALAYRDNDCLPGAGAPYIYAAKTILNSSKDVEGRERLAIEAFAESLYCIPVTIAENAGHNALDTLLKVEQINSPRYGIDATTCELIDAVDVGIIEPKAVVRQVVLSATEVANAILRIDDIIGRRGEDTGQPA